jgi:hypothetical protein
MISEGAKERRRERDRLKKQRRRARRKADKIQALTFSKTSAAYRRQLGRAPEMTKSELRSVIAAAARNTQAMYP